MRGADEAPAEPTKADLRRAQVLEAAAKCFNREGFHGASMANIASSAAMSVGQIYRYFENKEAVIAALVEQNMQAWGSRMAAIRTRGGIIDELIEVARYSAEKMSDPEHASLSLEFLAEAARNPRIAEIVRSIDSVVQAHLKDVLIRGGADQGPKLDCSLSMISMLMDGWVVRHVKDPTVSLEDYLASLRPLFEMLLRGEGSCPGAQAQS